MYGIFMESVVIFKLYMGFRIQIVLYLAAVIYLLVTEKDRGKRVVMLYTPLIILLLFFCPLFRKLFVALGMDGETYYRILWLIPMGVTIAYGACRVWEKHKRIGLAVMALLIVLGGTYVYNSPYVTKAENLYHIPDTVIQICDLIAPEEGEERITAAFPGDLVHFVRQYDTNIKMPYGREMVVERWDYYNEVYEVMEKPEIINARELLAATRNNYCEYIILQEDRQIDADLTDEAYGLVLLETIDGYCVYMDPTAIRMVKDLYQID